MDDYMRGKSKRGDTDHGREDVAGKRITTIVNVQTTNSMLRAISIVI